MLTADTMSSFQKDAPMSSWDISCAVVRRQLKRIETVSSYTYKRLH